MKHVHFIGIGGSGLSAIARLLLESGYTVSGSDRQLSPLAVELRAAGARVELGHKAENLGGAQLVIRSSAVADDNPEVQAARKAGLPVLKRSDFLGQLMEDRLGIAVAGTHGKTTTTAMIAWMLSALGQDPAFIVGGVLANLGTNAHAGKGPVFVIEADEYDRMFLGLRPKIEVVTNVEHDHPDCYPTFQEFQQAFLEFTDRLAPDGILMACGDDPGAAHLLEQAVAAGRQTAAYGINRRYDFSGGEVESNALGGFTFKVFIDEKLGASRLQPVEVRLQVPGIHNVRNALGALSVAHLLGLSLSDSARALAEFRGTGRRFERRGEAQGVVVIDDYAHHPTEIRATLAAARARFPERNIWAVWQPHTYSRTRALFTRYVTAFEDADHVVVTEVYPAREPIQPDFSARQVVAALSHADAHFIPDLKQVSAYLLERLQPGDVLLVLSAGDADQISAEVLEGLKGVRENVEGRDQEK